MRTVAVTQFKAQCLAILEEVSRTGEPVVVHKRGKPLVRVVRTTDDQARYPQRSLAGTVTIVGDVVGPALAAKEWEAESDRWRKRSRR